jgi:phosphatidylserine decarboxylase
VLNFHPHKKCLIRVCARILAIPFVSGFALLSMGVILREPLFYFIAVFMGFCFLFIIFFFRSPSRSFSYKNSIIVAPADGYIVQNKTVPSSQFSDGKATLISIFLTLWDVHINRIPVSGTVLKQDYIKGSFHFAFRNKASVHNESNTIILETRLGKVIVKQISGAIVRRIISCVKKDDVVQAGDLYGMIVFGSRVDLLLPIAASIQVQKGDHVKAGESIIGTIKNEP